MTYFIIKVGVNKGLIHIKSIFKILWISYYNGKVGVGLRGGTRFKSCPMHVINSFNIIFYLLYVL